MAHFLLALGSCLSASAQTMSPFSVPAPYKTIKDLMISTLDDLVCPHLVGQDAAEKKDETAK